MKVLTYPYNKIYASSLNLFIQEFLKFFIVESKCKKKEVFMLPKLFKKKKDNLNL
jgi:hypothetical protein